MTGAPPLVDRFAGGRRLSSALSWPVTNLAGETFYLSTGQRTLLFWIHAQMAYGRHTFTLDEASRAVGIDRSNVQRALDRFASWSLVRRRSTRGRLGITSVFPIKHAAAQRARLEGDPGRGFAPRSAWPTRRGRLVGNVATTTPFGGYISRARLATAGWQPGGRPPTPAGGTGAVGGERTRRYGPPRRLYVRCAAGCPRMVRLGRWHQARHAGRLSGRWSGSCRRCRERTDLTLSVELAPGGWVRVDETARRLGLEARHGPDRVAAVLGPRP